MKLFRILFLFAVCASFVRAQPANVQADPTTGVLFRPSAAVFKAGNGIGSGNGTVTSASVTTANGVSATVANPTTTPAFTFTLGVITPTSVNGITLSGTGSVANSGTTALTGFTGSGSSSGTNTGDQTSVSGNAGTATALLNARAIYGNNFDGTAALTQIIASIFGGTGNGFTKFTGPATAEKTFTLPDANATLLYSGSPLGTPSSGTLTNASGLPVGGITGFGTGVGTALGVNVGTAGAIVVNGGALGTPTSGVATNLTGTAASLTAGNVTTNANLTGDVTSSGNATTLTNAPVIAKVLTGYASGAGTVAATDSILQAIQKLNGNAALYLPLAGGTMTGAPTVSLATATTSTDGLIASTSTAATSGATQQLSPRVRWSGSAWNSSSVAAETASFIAETVPATAAGTISATWLLRYANSAVSAGAYATVLTIGQGGNLVAPGSITSVNVTPTGIFTGSTDTRSGAGAVSVNKDTTKYTSTGVADALTLANGTDGQIKHIIHDVDGGSGVLTPTTKTGFSTVTFTNAGDSVTLEYVTTRGWIVISSYGAVIAP